MTKRYPHRHKITSCMFARRFIVNDITKIIGEGVGFGERGSSENEKVVSRFSVFIQLNSSSRPSFFLNIWTLVGILLSL